MTAHINTDPVQLPSIRTIGISIWDPINAVQDHVNISHDLVHIVDGSVILHMNGKKYKAAAGDTLLIPQGTKHRDEFPLDSEFKALLIMFNWDRYDACFPPDVNRVLPRLPKGQKQKIKGKLTDLYSVFSRGEAFAEERTRAGLLDLLYYIAGLVQPQKKGAPGRKEKKQAIVDRAKHFISEHYAQAISLGDIARHLKLSEYHLSHLFSRESGFTLSAYVTEVRMEQAARLLADPTMQVSEVAYAVGYGNPNYFSKAFRRFHGSTPGAFRTRILRQKRK